MRVYICKKCGVRFSDSDIISERSSFSRKNLKYACPKCGNEDVIAWSGKARHEWKSVRDLIKGGK